MLRSSSAVLPKRSCPCPLPSRLFASLPVVWAKQPSPRYLSSSAAPRLRASPSPRSSLPWFVDPSTAPSPNAPPPAPLATAPVPTPPPSHLAAPLHPLHAHLSVSPFFDRDSLTYIHAREADPEGSWCDWVVLATLREGRERGLRGAVESVRSFLAKHPVELDPDDPSSSLPFAPPLASPSIHGLPAPASRHARSRSQNPRKAGGGAAPTRQDQAAHWSMLDAGTLVVHVMTRDAREEFGTEIERVWEGLRGEERREAQESERRRELEENLEHVRREMEEDERRAAAGRA
ncbi:SPOSA6832_03184, partial [Sporobolomyces salmonicolor]